MKQFVEVDGQQVFTADWLFQQMRAQSRRIDLARHIAILALVAAVLSAAVMVVTAVFQ